MKPSKPTENRTRVGRIVRRKLSIDKDTIAHERRHKCQEKGMRKMSTEEELNLLANVPVNMKLRRFSEFSTCVTDIGQLYEFKESVGQGFSATVFKAVRRSDRAKHALKVVLTRHCCFVTFTLLIL